MDASALLASQGWRGKGHSLHKTDDGIGLAKPLLLNRKDNTKGLGQKQHFTSDQWWMNAFDEQLQGLDTSKKGKVTQTITSGKLNAIEKGSLGKWALYSSFVRGGFLEGTVKTGTDEGASSDSDDEPSTPTLIPRSDLPDDVTESEEERRLRRGERRIRKEARRIRREARAREKETRRAAKAESKAIGSKKSKDADDKKKRRARKEEKRRKREEEGRGSG